MAQEPIITIEQGKLKGKTGTDIRGGQYFSFQGIPYARPPLGELRFKAPQPPEPWTGTWDATQERSECYSRHMINPHLIGSEDCLFLNVYTPELPSEDGALRPVMVWIHGGGFVKGSGNTDLYGPEFILPEDIVLVTINYRLGLLGFLSFEDDSLGVPGNAGLKDQVMALQWVQNNISKFNGDPNNVTIFGESAGGASVHYLVLSPMAEGLFHRAIVQSGCAISCRATGQRSTHLVAKALELDTVSEQEILKILKQMPVEKIFELQEKILDPFIANERRPYGPVVETTTKERAFLSEAPIDLVILGKYNKVPLMFGFTSREGMLLEIISKATYGQTKLITDFEKAVPLSLVLSLGEGSGKLNEIAQKIKRFYYGDRLPTLENIDQYYLLQTDILFLHAIHTAVKHHTVGSSSPVYYYRMSVESTLNLYKSIGQLKHTGVCHADDLGYLFKNYLSPLIRPQSIEDEAIRRFVKLWTTFARNGDPNPVEKDPLINVTWKPTEKDHFHYLEIGENLSVGVNPDASRMSFWDEIYSSYSNTANL